MSDLFPDEPCTTCGDECACGDQERALRRIAGDDWPNGPMSADQRAFCIDEIDSAGEGQYRRSESEAMDDKQLASTVLRAWTDYVRSNC